MYVYMHMCMYACNSQLCPQKAKKQRYSNSNEPTYSQNLVSNTIPLQNN